MVSGNILESFENSLAQAVLEASDNGILVIDNNRKVVECNSRFYELWKIPHELRASGEDDRLIDFVLDQLNEPQQFVDKIIELYNNPEVSSLDMLYFKDKRVFERCSKPMFYQNDIVARVWSFRDVTHTINMRKQLSKETSFRKNIIETLPDLIWLKDKDGVYLACNNRFEQFFGATEAEIVGKTDYDFVDSKLADFFRAHDKLAMASETPTVNDEWVTFASDGHKELLETTKTPMYDKNHQLIGVLGISHDITSREETSSLLKTIIQTVPYRIFWKDRELNYLGCNDLFAKDAGFETQEQLIGKSDFEMGWRDQAELYRADDANVIKTGNKTLGYEEPQTTPDGKQIWLRTSKVPITGADGEILGVLGTYDDITEIRNSQEQLRQRELYQRALLDNFPYLVWLKDKNGHFLTVSKPMAQLAGFKNAQELIGFTDHDVWPLDLAQAYVADDNLVMQSQTPVLKEEEVPENGKRKWVETYKAPIIDDDGSVFGTIGFARDITERKLMEEQLQHIAHFDSLTNLPNRLLLSDRLQQALVQSKRRNSSIAVVYLDLDGFKEVNDLHGHNVGDQLLVILAKRLKLALREGDTLSRLGGDEFVAILQDLDDTVEVKPVLERLLIAAGAPININEHNLSVSASIGVTFYPQDEEIDADQLIRQSDQAMYQAKQSGKDRFHIFDAIRDREIRSQHETYERLYKALKEEEFVLFYQPKVNMRSGNVLGVEALIRWDHPEKGILPPGAFLGDIANHHLMVEIGNWVLENAMKQIEEWRAMGIELKVSVNIDSMQLQQNSFIEDVKILLERYPAVSHGDLEFEILETSALDDVSAVSAIIKECQGLGISFSLDDFGTGYSSLTYLKRLPVKTLKIDQSFVFDLLDDPEELAIIEGIQELADTFGKDIIAEGVETIIHGFILLLMGCEVAQGYAVAKPMDAKAIVSWLHIWHSPLEWREQKVYTVDNLPLLYAIIEHRAKIKKIIDYLTHKSDTMPTLHMEHCNFGKWLNEEGRNILQQDVHVRVLDLHNEIHSLAKTVLQESLNGMTESIEKGIKRLENMRNEIVELLVNSAIVSSPKTQAKILA